MREIKFRAWDGDKIYPVAAIEQEYDYYQGHGYFPTSLAVRLADGGYLRYSPEFDMMDWVMQYTGLKDRNDKEIYEGDIVSYKIGAHKIVGDVKWDEKAAQFVKRAEQVQGTWDYKPVSSYLSSTEVIGNIYEGAEVWEEAA